MRASKLPALVDLGRQQPGELWTDLAGDFEARVSGKRWWRVVAPITL